MDKREMKDPFKLHLNSNNYENKSKYTFDTE